MENKIIPCGGVVKETFHVLKPPPLVSTNPNETMTTTNNVTSLPIIDIDMEEPEEVTIIIEMPPCPTGFFCDIFYNYVDNSNDNDNYNDNDNDNTGHGHGACVDCQYWPTPLSCHTKTPPVLFLNDFLDVTTTNTKNKEFVDLCLDSCFPHKCSENGEECPEGYFCDVDNQVCVSCHSIQNDAPFLPCLMGKYNNELELTALGQRSCVETCFQACSNEKPCSSSSLKSNYYCNFQFGTSGACVSCNMEHNTNNNNGFGPGPGWSSGSSGSGSSSSTSTSTSMSRFRHPMDCLDSHTVSPFQQGQESCLSTCFQPCFKDKEINHNNNISQHQQQPPQDKKNSCPLGSYCIYPFLDDDDDDDNDVIVGACFSCEDDVGTTTSMSGEKVIKDPYNCMSLWYLGGDFSTASGSSSIQRNRNNQQSCASSCFTPCSSAGKPCPAGSYCTYQHHQYQREEEGEKEVSTFFGSCVDCSDGDLIGSPIDCTILNKNYPLAEEECALECFGMVPCSDETPCRFDDNDTQDENSSSSSTTTTHDENKQSNGNTNIIITSSSSSSSSTTKSFCTFQSSPTMGFCLGCERFQDALSCFSPKWVYSNKKKYMDDANYFGVSASLQSIEESCASTCFTECSSSAKSTTTMTTKVAKDKDGVDVVGVDDCSSLSLLMSSDTRYFCNHQLGHYSGYCSSCQWFHSPYECFDSNIPLTVTGRFSCAETCFGTCSSYSDDDINSTQPSSLSSCGDGMFCSLLLLNDGDGNGNGNGNDGGGGEKDVVNGYCMNCNNIETLKTPYDCAQSRKVGVNLNPEGVRNCQLSCFGYCDATTPCEEGSFCNFQNSNDGDNNGDAPQSSGYCTSCNWREIDSVLDCIGESSVGVGLLPLEGQKSCANSCFETCSMENPCSSSEGAFCTFHQKWNNNNNNDSSTATEAATTTTGYCVDCNLWFLETPFDCQSEYWGMHVVGPLGREDCQNVCFGSCSVDNPCNNNSSSSIKDGHENDNNDGKNQFCTFQKEVSIDKNISDSSNNNNNKNSTGFCMDCSALREDPYRCDRVSNAQPQVLPELGQQSCKADCFESCSSDEECPMGSFCTLEFGTSGHCMGCRSIGGDPYRCMSVYYDNFTAVVQQSCLSRCFEPCLSDQDCPSAENNFGTVKTYDCKIFPVWGGSEETSGEAGAIGYCGFSFVGASGGGEKTPCRLCPDLKPLPLGFGQVPLNLNRSSANDDDKPPEDNGNNNTNTTDTGGSEGDIFNYVESWCPSFCPNIDMQYPNRTVRTFGHQCYKIPSLSVYDPTGRDCRLAKNFDYICGCTGNGYAGANSHAKQAVLAWLPRCMAVISFVSSLVIIMDICKSPQKRQRTFGQLMMMLSSFDMLGSLAYAFTTFPIPSQDQVYGAGGNEGTCKTQGFFIQMGMISAYINAALAVHYLLMLKYGWSETKISNKKPLLFGIPILIGLAFAFAGIPYYDNVLLWCNNATDSSWPDIPMAIAIGFVTIIMIIICWHVFREEGVSKKWRHPSTDRCGNKKNKKSLASKVLWQSVYYLMAFYMVWPPYLALQYMWVYGTGYDKYGFVLFAGTLVPLQGFWNLIVYFRPRWKGQRLSFLFGRMSSVLNSFRPSSSSNSAGAAAAAAAAGSPPLSNANNANSMSSRSKQTKSSSTTNQTTPEKMGTPKSEENETSATTAASPPDDVLLDDVNAAIIAAEKTAMDENTLEEGPKTSIRSTEQEVVMDHWTCRENRVIESGISNTSEEDPHDSVESYASIFCST